MDTAQHTLEECGAWAEEREVLRAALGEDLSLPAVMEKILREEDAWRAFLSFAESVIFKKESAERIRRGEVAPAGSQAQNDPGGRRGGGRRRHRRRPRRRGAAHLRA